MYKYKLKEIEVGDTEIRGGKKSTVTDIDPVTGGITWSITDVAAFDTVYKTFNKLKKFLKKLEATGEAEKDPVIDEIAEKVEDLFSDYWTHIRAKYPDAYDKIKLTKESVNDDDDWVNNPKVDWDGVAKEVADKLKGGYWPWAIKNGVENITPENIGSVLIAGGYTTNSGVEKNIGGIVDKVLALVKESVNEEATDRFLQSAARNLAKQMRGKSASRDTLMNRLNSMPLASRLKSDELDKIVNYVMQEMGLIDEGEGEGYLTPKAFDKNKKSTGANDIYYYKLGYKPVPKKIKGSGLEVKQLFEKEELKEYSDFQQKRIQQFADVEEKLNQISPLLSNAKNETAKYYNENPGSYEVVYSTDMVGSLVDDIIELLKQEEWKEH